MAYVLNDDYKTFVEYALRTKKISHTTIEKYNANSLINQCDPCKIKYVFFDLETSPQFFGQKLVDSSIIEIGAYCDGAEFNQLCNPQHRIINSNIHNITDEMVSSKLCTNMCISMFINWLNGIIQNGIIILIAHNGASFDKHVLINHINKYNMSTLNMNHICVADTRYILAKYYKELQSKSLESIYKHIFNDTYIEKHRAIDDARDLKKICVHTMQKLNICIKTFVKDHVYLLKFA